MKKIFFSLFVMSLCAMQDICAQIPVTDGAALSTNVGNQITMLLLGVNSFSICKSSPLYLRKL